MDSLDTDIGAQSQVSRPYGEQGAIVTQAASLEIEPFDDGPDTVELGTGSQPESSPCIR
jgi:hypothetical protein